MSVTLDTERLIVTIRGAVLEAVDAETRAIEQNAKRFAPVRKVFNSKMLGSATKTRRRRQIVGISSTQLNAEADIRNRLGLGPRTVNVAGSRVTALSVMREPNTYRRVAKRTLSSEMLDMGWYGTLSAQMKRSRRSGAALLDIAQHDPRLLDRNLQLRPKYVAALTARGRYEYEHAEKRGAIATAHGDRWLGGRLRSEIRAFPVEVNGQTFVGRVVSPTPYAKYVEFGTRHAPAQPFLRPAANLARRHFRKTLQRSLDSVGRKWRK